MSKGRRLRTGIWAVRALPRERPPCRFLLAVPRRCGSAPRRNRIKRVVREALRHDMRRFQLAWDVCLLCAYAPKDPPTLAAFSNEMERLWRRLEDWSAAPSA